MLQIRLNDCSDSLLSFPCGIHPQQLEDKPEEPLGDVVQIDLEDKIIAQAAGAEVSIDDEIAKWL